MGKQTVSTRGVIKQEINCDSTWSKCVSELVDNSLDAKASWVRVEIVGKAKNWRLIVSDDGVGAPDIERMFRFGDSTKDGDDPTVGKYGVGLKHASMWLCGWDGTTTVISMHAGRCHRLRVLWGRDTSRDGEDCLNLDDQEDVTQFAAQLLADGRGTKIELACITRQMSKSIADVLIRDLRTKFSPAIKSGRKIVVTFDGKETILRAADLPAFTDFLPTRTLTVHGRTATITAYLRSASDKSDRFGINFSYLHRVILSDSAAGFGTFTPGGMVVGDCVLDAGWELERHKTNVSDRRFPDLCDAICDYLRPLLEKAQQASDLLRCDSVHNEALAQLHGILGERERKRGTRVNDPDGEREGTDGDGTKTGSPQTKATNVDETKPPKVTEKQGRGRVGGILPEPVDRPNDKRMSWVNGQRVQYNRKHPWVAKVIVEGKNSAALALLIARTFLGTDAAKKVPWLKKEVAPDNQLGELMSRSAGMQKAPTTTPAMEVAG